MPTVVPVILAPTTWAIVEGTSEFSPTQICAAKVRSRQGNINQVGSRQIRNESSTVAFSPFVPDLDTLLDPPHVRVIGLVLWQVVAAFGTPNTTVCQVPTCAFYARHLEIRSDPRGPQIML